MIAGTYDHLKANFGKFKNSPYRQYQEEAVSFILESKKKIVVITAPTGSGKSLLAMAAGSHYSNFTYLVSSKALQGQLQNDFPEVAVMKGRNNYVCLYNQDLNCDQCMHKVLIQCEYYKDRCPYEVQKRIALGSRWRLLNYHFYLYETAYAGAKFGGSKILLCDEGDLLEGLLADFISLSIPARAVKRLQIPKPKYVTAESKNGVASWIEWAEKVAHRKISNRISRVRSEIEDSSMGDPDLPKLHRELKGLGGVLERVNIFIKNVDKEWVFEEDFRGGYNFKPTWIPEELSDRFFFKTADRFVLMSATFPPPEIMGKLLGRQPGDFDYFESGSTFPVKNRQVYVRPAGDLTYKTFSVEAPKVIKAVEKIVQTHPHEKGLIHAVSYKLADMIMNINGNTGGRLITHRAEDREQVLNAFKESKLPMVLVSPSMERGVDLPDEMARFIIFAKAPFLSLADKLVKKRVYGSNIGNLWYKSNVAQTIVQGCGRGVRHKEDRCVSYLIDKQIFNLIANNRRLFPEYWLQAIEI